MAENGRSHLELMASLCRADTVEGVAIAFGNYCRKALESPAGAVFVEREGELELVSQWRSSRVSEKELAADVIKKGPATRALRTGRSIFWSRTRRTLSIARVWRRLCLGQRRRDCAFLPLRVSEGKPFGVVALVFAHQYESTRDECNEMLSLCQICAESIDRARCHERFLAVLSHELKNPITPILGWSVALRAGRIESGKLNQALDNISRNIRALNELIDDLFDACRLSAGKLRLELSNIRLQDLAREAVATIQPTAEAKSLRISTSVSDLIPPFSADARRIRQVLLNLLSNAVKFTPPGGAIGVRIAKEGNFIVCAVSDSGRGFAPQFLPFVFERFRQENRASKGATTGLGLGLSVVREIVQLHGGSVKALSPGRNLGATFIVRLPARRVHQG